MRIIPSHAPYKNKNEKKSMKKVTSLIVFSFLLLVTKTNAQPPAAIQLANHIAKKMKDTLGLTPGQRAQVFAKNIVLHYQKMTVRQQNTNPDSIRIKTQIIEGKRDSLYHTILPQVKYTLYLQKKKNLVSAN
jgi:hypothetical protein